MNTIQKIKKSIDDNFYSSTPISFILKTRIGNLNQDTFRSIFEYLKTLLSTGHAIVLDKELRNFNITFEHVADDYFISKSTYLEPVVFRYLQTILSPNGGFNQKMKDLYGENSETSFLLMKPLEFGTIGN